MAINTTEDLFNVLNQHNINACFKLFTKILFKVLLNMICIPSVHSMLLDLWLRILQNFLAERDT